MAPKKTTKTKTGSAKKTISVMDVSKPGKTPPTASSRPIIVGHRPVVKDTTVSLPVEDDKSNNAGERIQVSRTAPKVIQPPADLEAENSSLANPEKEKPESSETEQSTEANPDSESNEATVGPGGAADESTEPPTSEENQPSPSDSEDTTAETMAVDAIAGQAPDRKAEAEQTEAEHKKQEHLSQLVAEKKYQLPIRTAKRRRRTGWLALLLIVVLLLAAGFYVLRYTDLVDTNAYNLPSWLTGQTDSDQDESPSGTSDTNNEDHDHDTSVTPAPSAKDAQRESDINAIAAALESYHAANGHYPSLGQLNDPNFRADNLASLDPEVYQDPDGDSSILAVSTSSGMYGYSATPAGCDNQTTDCTAFTLTATLSDDTTYEKTSLVQ